MRYGEVMSTRGFPALLGSLFLGALNDNLCRITVSLFAAAAAAAEGGGLYLALSGALFTLPYLLFSGYAGHLADALDKRRVLILTKVGEIGAMVLALLAFRSGQIEAMLGVLFLLGLLATFFSPARYGILPEILADRDLSRGNALGEMSSFLAIILGTALGSAAYDRWQADLTPIGVIAIAVAVAGAACSLFIAPGRQPERRKPFPLLPWGEIVDGGIALYRDRRLRLAVVGITYFWFAGALIQLDIILIGTRELAVSATEVGLLQAALGLGIGAGTIAAGRLSGDKVELGLVPLGALGMVLGAVLLWLAPPSYGGALAALVLLGGSAGLFIIPLNAFLQQRTLPEERGRMIATNNVVNTVGILLASAVLWLLRDVIGLSPAAIALATAAMTLAVAAYIVTLVPDFLVRFLLWMLTHSIYRIRILGQPNLPVRGPALLVCNHVSFVDGLLVGACLQRFVRFMIYKRYFEMRPLAPLFRLMQAIPVPDRNPKEILRALQRARQALAEGHVVCIFAEGALSRSGNTLPFRRGLERIVEGLDVPIVPVHLDRVWGSIFSFKRGRFFWKWPERLLYPVTVSFGPHLPPSADAWTVRQAVLELGAEAFAHRRHPGERLEERFVKVARRRWRRLATVDSTGTELSYGRLLAGSLALARALRGRLPPGRFVGVLLPASVPAVLANLALLLAGRIPVNLNFTVGAEALDSAARQCELKAIVTARPFLARAKLAARDDMVFVEEILAGLSERDRAAAWLSGRLLPMAALRALFGARPDRQDPATVLFSSGSTGQPKGVMLSHGNILANVEAVAQVLWIDPQDRVLGVLPFFHAFGLTGTLWVPLLAGIAAVYHANPLDAKKIGELAQRYRATVLIATPSFCQAYLRGCEPEQLRGLRHVVVGAERLQPKLAAAFREKFGVELLEGYGATEMGPVVAVNVADVVDGPVAQTGRKPGSVGHPLPGVAARVVDPDSGVVQPPGQPGLLLLRGPSRMTGYLGDPERTAAVLREGWYVTGDIATIDEDGFITITDRLARFSKIGGEMVPHLRIEEAIAAIPGIEGCAVTAVPDPGRGERLVAFYVGDGVEPAAVADRLGESGLPPLWRPKPRDIARLASLPLLPSGKLDLRAVKAMAMAGSE
jgi:acyl-[acyl-carrier-protein]-phospholipid O-acyltransferase/long-chain-fatty-acid--[acyl-carrier-protein] ligase